MLDALRLRQRVRSNLARGIYERHEAADLAHWQGCASQCQHVAVHLGAVELTDLRSRAVQRWPLSAVGSLTDHLPWCSWGAGALAVPFGVRKPPQPAQGSGVLLVNTRTGACQQVELPFTQQEPLEHIRLSE